MTRKYQKHKGDGRLKTLGVLGGMAAAALLLCIGEMYREQKIFQVTKYVFQTKKVSPSSEKIKILFLSDQHNKIYGNTNEVLYEAVWEEKPDLILIGGDMLIGKRGVSAKPALDFVSRLPRICPVYYVNGNHEQRMKEGEDYFCSVYENYKKTLQKAGVYFLENESVNIDIRGTALCISGLELPLHTYKKFQTFSICEEDIKKYIGDAREERLHILLAHNPAFAEAYKKWGADLVLAGHLHGGLVRFPGWRGVITPQFKLFPKYSGEMQKENGQAVIVSRGLGMHTIKIRLFNKAEIVSVSLVHPAEKISL